MAITLLGGLAAKTTVAQAERWLVYYSNTEPTRTFNPYSLLILDGRYHPPLRPLAESGKTLVGYLSLGEAAKDYTYFGALQSEGLLVRPSSTWQGNYYIDIRDPRWRARVCESIIPEILARGFHGLFLDTLDNALHLEQTDPAKYKGMNEAGAQLISAIRCRFPKILLVLNRAYTLLDTVVTDIDVALGESVYATFDFQRKKYCLVDAGLYKTQVTMLQAAVRKRPGLRIFTLDYWDPSDAEGIARIYKEQRSNGFSPYVATIDLTRIVNEPVVP